MLQMQEQGAVSNQHILGRATVQWQRGRKNRPKTRDEMRPRTAAKMLTLTGLLMMSCGDGEGPASPTPTPTPTPTRQLQEVTWECDREDTTVGVDLHCHATGRYNTEPQEASLTSSLTDSMVHTSDANVLSPEGYREDVDEQPFVVEARGAGQAEVWVTFDGHTSNRWRVTVNAVRDLMGVDWSCDRQEAKPGEDIYCQGTAQYSEDPRQVRITDQLSRDTVQTTDASVLQPQEYRTDLEGAPFVVAAAGAGEAATWIEFKGRPGRVGSTHPDAADHACAGAARFPHFHSASSSSILTRKPRSSRTCHDVNPKASTRPRDRGNLRLRDAALRGTGTGPGTAASRRPTEARSPANLAQ